MDNRLKDIFNALDAPELRQLAKYLRSPLFNRQDVLIKLFDYLRKKQGKPWDNQATFKHLYPSESFDMQQLHYAHSFLLKQIEGYLVWKSCMENPIEKELYLLSEYRKKHLEKAFDRTLKKVDQLFNKSPLRNHGYHEYQLEIKEINFLHQRDSKRTREFKFQELSDTQDIAFIASKLQKACTILSHQTMTQKDYDQGLLSDVLSRVEKESKYLDYPAIAVYYHAYKALSNINDETHYFLFKELIENEIIAFPMIEKRDIHILATNYCIRRLNTGDKKYIREAFETYRRGLQLDVFIEDGILSRWTYNNIIVLGLKLKEFDWVEIFIHSYKNQLDEKTREDSFNFNLAKFYFEKKDYQKTMPLLIQTKYDDLLHNLGAKTMLAKMYYELEEWDSLENLLDSFKIYIQRKKDIGYHKENYMNIISFIKKLVQINSFDKSNLKQLREQIITTPVLTEREWLLKRLGEKS